MTGPLPPTAPTAPSAPQQPQAPKTKQNTGVAPPKPGTQPQVGTPGTQPQVGAPPKPGTQPQVGAPPKTGVVGSPQKPGNPPSPAVGAPQMKMPGDKTGVRPDDVKKLDQMAQNLVDKGYKDVRIKPTGGHRTLDQQVQLLATNRTFGDFKAKMAHEVKAGNISQTAANKWVTHYDPKGGKHALPKDSDLKGSPTKTLKSDHIVGKGVDIGSRKAEGNKTTREQFYKDLKAAAQKVGFTVPWGWDPNHVRFR